MSAAARMAATCSTSYAAVPASLVYTVAVGRQRQAQVLTVAQPLAHLSGSACTTSMAAWRYASNASPEQRHRKRQRRVQASAGSRPPVKDEKEGAPPAAQAASTKWLDRIAARWRRLSPQQQVYAVVAGAVLSAVLWQLLTFGVVLLERLLLGSLIAAEEALLSVVVVAVGVFLVFAAVNAVGVGAYLLGGGNDSEKPGRHDR